MHQQVGGRVLLPVHWGTFNLAFHPWDEPERVLVAARAAGVSLVLPRPGEPIEPNTRTTVGTADDDKWWRTAATRR